MTNLEKHGRLRQAILAKNIKKVASMMDEINLNIKLDGDNNPLFLAIQLEAVGIIDLLLSAGINIDARNYKGQTALIQALNHSHCFIIPRLLLRKGTNVNLSDNKGWTALMYAAKYNRTDLIKDLLKAGSDTSIQSNDGKTVYDIAFQTNQRFYFELHIQELFFQTQNDTKQIDDVQII